MLPGDSVTKERVEFVHAGDDGNQAVWDFSNLESFTHTTRWDDWFRYMTAMAI